MYVVYLFIILGWGIFLKNQTITDVWTWIERVYWWLETSRYGHIWDCLNYRLCLHGVAAKSNLVVVSWGLKHLVFH